MNRKGVVEIKKLLIIILLILSTLCLSPDSDADSQAVEEAYICSDCNVIIISIDTLRADHLGGYGYLKNTSPEIDRFAGESVLFENAIVQASWTVPSHMSIMTSLYPSVHKAQEFPNASMIDESVITLAQTLNASGYRTVSFNGGGAISDKFGFDRGFDLYISPSRDNIEITNDAALNWLSENRDQKFFLFFHTYTVHRPYLPPLRYRNKVFPDYNFTTDKKYTLGPNIWKKYWNKTIGDEDLQKVIALYDGEINYVDHEMGHFFDDLDRLNLSNNTIIIFTSDHGDGFFEHKKIDHILTSYQELIHVPLIIRFPGIKSGRIKNLAQSIDIMPTVLDALNITAPSQVQGVSLMPLIIEGENVNSYAYSEGGLNGEVKAIIDEDLKWKYIYNIENKHEELYDLENDPKEQDNLVNEKPEIAENLREQLFGWMEENERLAEGYSSIDIELENETKEALKALGYIT